MGRSTLGGGVADKRRDRELEARGVRVLRLPAELVRQRPEQAVLYIVRALTPR